MNDLVAQTYSASGVVYTYQILDEVDGFRIWKSTSPMTGGYILGSYDELYQALFALADHIQHGEI